MLACACLCWCESVRACAWTLPLLRRLAGATVCSGTPCSAGAYGSAGETGSQQRRETPRTLAEKRDAAQTDGQARCPHGASTRSLCDPVDASRLAGDLKAAMQPPRNHTTCMVVAGAGSVSAAAATCLPCPGGSYSTATGETRLCVCLRAQVYVVVSVLAQVSRKKNANACTHLSACVHKQHIN